MQRRRFLGSALAAAGMSLLAQLQPAGIGESDAANAKLCHGLDAQGHCTLATVQPDRREG